MTKNRLAIAIFAALSAIFAAIIAVSYFERKKYHAKHFSSNKFFCKAHTRSPRIFKRHTADNNCSEN